jgi:hypothetical protein
MGADEDPGCFVVDLTTQWKISYSYCHVQASIIAGSFKLPNFIVAIDTIS